MPPGHEDAPADRGELHGLVAGSMDPVAMIDGKPFKPGTAHEGGKLSRMIVSRKLWALGTQMVGLA